MAKRGKYIEPKLTKYQKPNSAVAEKDENDDPDDSRGTLMLITAILSYYIHKFSRAGRLNNNRS